MNGNNAWRKKINRLRAAQRAILARSPLPLPVIAIPSLRFLGGKTLRFTYSILRCSPWLLALLLGFQQPAQAQENAPTPADPEILKQLFPDKPRDAEHLPQYRSIKIDLNGDGTSEWVVVYNPNPVAKKKKKTRDGCLCPKPTPQGDKETLKRIEQIQTALESRADYLYEIKLTAPKKPELQVYYQLEGKPKMEEGDLLFDMATQLGRKMTRWKKWGITGVRFVNVDNNKTSTLKAWHCQKLSKTPVKRRRGLFDRWRSDAGETAIKLCPCPKKKPERIVYKPLQVVVATEVIEKPATPPAGTPAEPKEGLPETPKPAGPRLREVGRFDAENIQIRPLTQDGKIAALHLESVLNLESVRTTQESLYLYDEGNKNLRKILSLNTQREGDDREPGSRQWSQLTFKNMDADAWQEIIVDSFYETPRFNGMLKREMYKYFDGAYRPLNEVRGILKVTTSSIWSKVAPEGSSIEQQRLAQRVSPANLVDGFRDSAWVSAQQPRGIGSWAKIEFIRPKSVIGIAVAAQIPDILKHIEGTLFPGGFAAAPLLQAPTYLRVVTSNNQSFDFALDSSRPYTFFRFPQASTIRHLQIEIVSSMRDSSGKTLTLNVPPKENTLGYLSEVVPVFDEITYTASSFDSKSVEQYLPSFAGDNKDSTAWGEGRDDDGIGEWLQMVLPAPREISKLAIQNGCRRPGERYILNNRVRKARLTFSNGSTQEVELKDTDAKQIVTIRTTRTSAVKLTILSIYKGKLGSLTCITEFSPHP